MRKTIEVIQGDYGYDINFTLQDDDGNIENITGATLTFKAQRQGSSTINVSGTMTIVDGASGQCKYTVQNGDFDEAGEYYAEIELNAGKVVTWSGFTVVVAKQLPR